MAQIRCAIYTRKSSEEGLDQDFNSLEAQREACEAYIKSQAPEGWQLDPTRYDDGGFSGGTMDRPALVRLMAAIKMGKVDRIVVYKIDRLTRSLADFAKLVDDLDAVGASFVSVTQSFNTSTSMGRLTLNVLLSFAQFEREVTAERIRDKLAASKAKGLWMGGRVPTGYDADNRSLKINTEEAETIKLLFDLYLDLGSVPAVEDRARREGLVTKHYRTKSGLMLGGKPFSRGLIYRVLNNPIYIGRIPHKQTSYPGLHQPIIDVDVWDRVQHILADRPRKKGGRNQTGILSGRLTDCDGIPMTRHTTNPRGKSYAYYLTGKASQHNWRIKSADLEAAVAWAVKQTISRLRPTYCANLTSDADIERLDAAKSQLQTEPVKTLLSYVDFVQIGGQSISLVLNRQSVQDALSITLIKEATLSNTFDIEMVKRGHELKLVYDAQSTNPDLVLQRALRKSLSWKSRILAGESISDIARSDDLSVQVTARRIRLALLSPKIQLAIAKGTQPPSLTLQRIIKTKLPTDWNAQEAMLLEQGN